VNPLIPLQGSPFSLVEKTREWRGSPLRAGVSSFGIGGVNGHVVLEEHVANESSAALPSAPALIVLSARTAERLEAQAMQLLSALRARDWRESDLHRIAYTLQVGREAMQHRLALRVTSLENLQAKLVQFLDGATHDPDLYRGVVKRAKQAAGAPSEIIASTAAQALQQWVEGASVDWRCAYEQHTPTRISLPTYPFAKDRYWIDLACEGAAAEAPVVTAPPRPRTELAREPLATGLQALLESVYRGARAPELALQELTAAAPSTYTLKGNEPMGGDDLFSLVVTCSREVIPELTHHRFERSDRLGDLGANSVDRADILMMVLEALALRIPRVELFGAATVGELVDLLHDKLHPV
jgi:polyketide synthase PksL